MSGLIAPIIIVIIATAVAIRGVVFFLQIFGIAGKTPERFSHQIRTDRPGRAYGSSEKRTERVDLSQIDRTLRELPKLGETLHAERGARAPSTVPPSSSSAPHIWSADELKKWSS